MTYIVDGPASGWASNIVGTDFQGAVDALYNIFTARLRSYPVADAFVSNADTSQSKWGLQLTQRWIQNASWTQEESLGVASGNGALSVNSITYPFTRNIKKITSGQLSYSVMSSNWTILDANLATEELDNPRSASSATPPIYGGYGGAQQAVYTNTQQTTYIATSAWNKFMFIHISGTDYKIVEINATNYAYIREVSTHADEGLLGALNQYYWVFKASTREVIMYELDSLGVRTQVWSPVSVNITIGAWQMSAWSYARWNTLYCGVKRYSATDMGYFQIDMSVTTGPSVTIIWTNIAISSGNTHMKVMGHLDSSDPIAWSNAWLLVAVGRDDLFLLEDTGTFLSFPGAYDNPAHSSFTSCFACALRWGSNLVQNFDTENFYSTVDGVFIKWTRVSPEFNNIGRFVIYVYELDSVADQDALFVGALFDGVAICPSDGLVTLTANGANVAINPLPSNEVMLPNAVRSADLLPININQQEINFELSFANALGREFKLGFDVDESLGNFDTPVASQGSSEIRLEM